MNFFFLIENCEAFLSWIGSDTYLQYVLSEGGVYGVDITSSSHSIKNNVKLDKMRLEMQKQKSGGEIPKK